MKPIFLAPNQKIPEEILKKLQQVNDVYTKNKNFVEYKKNLEVLFCVKPKNNCKELRNYLGGFITGDGSINVSAKKEARAKFGVVLDPEFSATQHINGIDELVNLLSVLNTGRISYKNKSNATMVYIIGARQSLIEKVLPFYEQHVIPYCSPIKAKRFDNFKKLLKLFEENAHLDKNRFINEMLPLWDQMRMQINQTNQSFKTLEQAQTHVRNKTN